MELKDDQIKDFKKNGYLVLPDFFSHQEMNDLAESIENFVNDHEGRMKERKEKDLVSRADEILFTDHIAEQSPEVMEFVKKEKLTSLVNQFINTDLTLYWNQSVYKKPEVKKDFPWHQDNGYAPVEPEEYITCWIALEDATIENGCIWVLPGSHKQGTVPHKETPIGMQCYFGDQPGTPVPLKKGGMVVFSSLLFHRSGPNVTKDQIRKAFIVQYTPAHAKNGDTGEFLNGDIIYKNVV